VILKAHSVIMKERPRPGARSGLQPAAGPVVAVLSGWAQGGRRVTRLAEVRWRQWQCPLGFAACAVARHRCGARP